MVYVGNVKGLEVEDVKAKLIEYLKAKISMEGDGCGCSVWEVPLRTEAQYGEAHIDKEYTIGALQPEGDPEGSVWVLYKDDENKRLVKMETFHSLDSALKYLVTEWYVENVYGKCATVGGYGSAEE